MISDRKGTPKNFLCDKLSGELSGAICLKTLVLLGSALEVFRNFFGAVREMFWLGASFWALEIRRNRDVRKIICPLNLGFSRPPPPHFLRKAAAANSSKAKNRQRSAKFLCEKLRV